MTALLSAKIRRAIARGADAPTVAENGFQEYELDSKTRMLEAIQTELFQVLIAEKPVIFYSEDPTGEPVERFLSRLGMHAFRVGENASAALLRDWLRLGQWTLVIEEPSEPQGLCAYDRPPDVKDLGDPETRRLIQVVVYSFFDDVSWSIFLKTDKK